MDHFHYLGAQQSNKVFMKDFMRKGSKQMSIVGIPNVIFHMVIIKFNVRINLSMDPSYAGFRPVHMFCSTLAFSQISGCLGGC